MEKSSSSLEAWAEYVGAASACVRGVAVTLADGTPIEVSDGFGRWIALAREGRDAGHRMHFIGNGASAMMASHFAADACKNAGLSAMAFNDVNDLMK